MPTFFLLTAIDVTSIWMARRWWRSGECVMRMTQVMAERLARDSKYWVARKIQGEWCVWSSESDHVVEFASNMLEAAARADCS